MTDSPELEYRAAYDAQLRARLRSGTPVDRVGPVLRKVLPGQGGLILYQDLGGLDGAELDAFIAAQREYFAGLGLAVEWKYHGHDRPADLPDRLRAAGFEPEERETVIVGETAAVAGEVRLPDGVELREVTSRADLERIGVLNQAVWGGDWSWLVDALADEVAGQGDPCVVVTAEAEGTVVCAAWVRFHTGTDFASFWGGSTLPEWRGKGLYRALVAHRANLALARGHRYVQVDALDTSRPILTRLGLLPVATTTPYVWTPPAAD
ncbi:GNAT family N-acetyltransferase [Streptomyces sp. NPDC051940]|uniref:GNAT family N-acetyltransferase n=1 Tax=Streptomyces sp. NPDC051940 TaxID=3155675 RepID=UPI003446E354